MDKPNNSEKKPSKKDMLVYELCELSNSTDDKITNMEKITNITKTNTTNINNITNTTNIISLLGNPTTQAEAIYFYLYKNEEAQTEELLKVAKMEKQVFWNLTSKDSNITKRKQGKKAFYKITQELREQLDLRIKQKLESKKRELEAIAQQKEIEKSKEEQSQEISNILENKSLISSENGFVYLDLKELKEQNPEVFENLQNHPESTKELLENSLKEKGLENPLRFSNFTESLKPQTIDKIRTKDIDKLLLIECRSSILTDVRPQITKIKFECPSCGTIISVLQIDKKIKEPSRCSCGRRGGFKEISRDLIDRARVELEDLTDLTETPQIKSIQGFVKSHLTEVPEYSKLHPGNEVKVLGILKTAEQTIGGAKGTALDIFLEILEIEPFEPTIDLSSFSEEEIKEYDEISKTIKEENDLREIRESFAPDIIGNEKPKDSLLLKSAQSRGRKNKSNVLFISNPGNAKSIIAKKYHKIVPGTSYISGAGSSAVGLTATAEKKDEGWVLKPGVLVTTKEDVIADEFNLIGDEEKPKLQEAMSEGQITINKASIHAKLKVSCGILACANPRDGIFNETEDIVKQFNIQPQILNRFDSVFIISDSTTTSTDEAIAKQMLKREDNQIEQKYSDEKLKRFFLYVRSQEEPTFEKELIEKYIPKKYSEIRNSMRYTGEKRIINPRFIESVIRLSKAMAKIKRNKRVSREDVDFCLELLKNTYLNWEVVSNE